MNNEYICDDREKEIPEDILNMTDEECREAFKQSFGKYPTDE